MYSKRGVILNILIYTITEKMWLRLVRENPMYIVMLIVYANPLLYGG